MFFKQFGKIGKATAEIYEEVKKQYEVYEKQITETDEDKIADFMTEAELKVGSPYELDPVSAIIQDRVNSLSALSADKESVLIIDDLDRLDPEHIFRLFNVFSVHFNQYYNTNKFGFDKIIFVCDINNIKHIYHHKYGKNVDFVGYIDKFYAVSPFEFDIKQFIKHALKDILLSNIIIDLDNRFSLEKMKQGYEDSRFLICLRSIIISLIDSKRANLRMLIHPKSIGLNKKNSNDYYFNFNYGDASLFTDFEIIVVFCVLKSLYGSFDSVENVLVEMAQNNSYHKLTDRTSINYYVGDLRAYREIISYCLPFHIKYTRNQNRGTEIVHVNYSNEIYTCKLNNHETFVHFREFPNYNYYKYRYNFEKFTAAESYQSEEEFINPYEFLYQTFKICKERGTIL